MRLEYASLGGWSGGGWGSTKVGTAVEHEWSAEWSDGGGDLAKESGKNVLHLPSPISHVSAVSERVRRADANKAHSTPAHQPPNVRAQCGSATDDQGEIKRPPQYHSSRTFC